MRGHIIVCGEDALATRIIDELTAAELTVVPLHAPDQLRAAGVETAAAVIAAAHDDAVNLEVALLARRISPQARVVARLANTVLRQAMSDGDEATVLDVAELAAPSVVEALLSRNTHSIEVGGEHFVVADAAAPRDGTLRQIYGRLAPVAVVRGADSPNPGELIACPPLDLPVREGDATYMIGRADDLAAHGFQPFGPEPDTMRHRSLPGRMVDSVRAFADDVNPAFYPAVAVLGTLLLGSTVILRLAYRHPNMSWMDALYFSSETLATVGYGDFNFLHQPLWLRLWGVVMMLSGLATTAVVVSFVSDVLISRRLSKAASRQRVSHLRGHHVIVGLGSFGVKVIRRLRAAGCTVVAVERNENNRYLGLMRELKVPVIFGDATLDSTLNAAHVGHARSVAVLTRDDMVNIETGLVLREVVGAEDSQSAKRIPIVLRIYDRALGDAVGHRLGFNHVRSTVDLAAPWFIGAAMGLEVLGTFSVGQASFMLGGVEVGAGSELDGIRIEHLSTHTRVIVLEQEGQESRIHPHKETQLRAGDTAYLVGPYRELLATLGRGQRPAQPPEEPKTATNLSSDA